MHISKLISERLRDGWVCEASGRLFLEIYPQSLQLPDHGWKIRCNTTCLEKLGTLILRVSDICFEEGIPLKIVNGETSMRILHSKSTDFRSAGKSITLYPGDAPNRLVAMLKKVEHLRKKLDLPPAAPPWSDKQFSSNVSYRYGSYGPSEILRFGSLEVPDSREGFSLPPGIKDPLSDAQNTQQECFEPAGSVIVNGYEISDCVSRNWGGSVYLGSYRSQHVILKEARPHARIACEAFSTDLLKNEFQVMTALAGNAGILPPIDLFEMNGYGFLLMPRHPGVSLAEWKFKRLRTPKQLVEIARRIATTLLQFHETQTAHLDLSASNFIVDVDSEAISLIDFENTALNASDAEIAEDAKQFAEVLRWLAMPTLATLPSRYTEAIRMGSAGASMGEIVKNLSK